LNSEKKEVRLWRRDLNRNTVFNLLPSVPIDNHAKVTRDTCKQADSLFEVKLKNAEGFKTSKVEEKRLYFRKLLHAGKCAYFLGGCVRLSRNYHDPDCSKLKLQVADAAVSAGLFSEYRSPKGSRRMSRLLPSAEIGFLTSTDPWDFDPEVLTCYVRLHTRGEKPVPLKFDPTLTVPRMVQQQLELINGVNSRFEITVVHSEKWWANETHWIRRLRPIHRAAFTESFDLHGRLYTGRHGHQSLSKIERKTICFNGERSQELDFVGMHCRLLYHLAGVPFAGDPYSLWAEKTTDGLRAAAKIAINALINAPSCEAAVAACNFKISEIKVLTNGKKARKTGKELDQSRKLRRSLEIADVSFKSVCETAQKYHYPISSQFGSDMGMKLMRVDAEIALGVLSYFANLGKPCLSVHDSFLVRAADVAELRDVMTHVYAKRIGFQPVIK
jgi:hypothetical protein